MKITNKSQQIASIQKPPAAEPARLHEEEGGQLNRVQDRVDVSSAALEKAKAQEFTKLANNSSVVDEQRVASLKQAIADGEYNPDPVLIAEKMIEEEQDFQGF